jgi:hypothetical protein
MKALLKTYKISTNRNIETLLSEDFSHLSPFTKSKYHRVYPHQKLGQEIRSMYEYLPLFGMGYPEKMHTMTGRTSTIACTVQFVWKKTKGIESMVIYFDTAVKNEKGDAILM